MEDRHEQRVDEQGVKEKAGRQAEPDNPNGSVTRAYKGPQTLVGFDPFTELRIEVAEADLDQAELAGDKQRVQEQDQDDSDKVDRII
jgi:hypothetical protein